MGRQNAGKSYLFAAVVTLTFLGCATVPDFAQDTAASAEETCPKIPRSADWSQSDAVLLAQSTVDQAASLARSNQRAFERYLPQLNRALAVCAEANPDGARSGNLTAYACTGDADYLIAQFGSLQPSRDAQFKQAYCVFTAASRLAANETSPNRLTLLARIFEGRGKVRDARADLGGPRMSQYRYDAIDDYGQAVRIEPTHARYLAIARAQVAVKLFREASASYDSLQNLKPDPVAFPDGLRAQAFREQAKAQQQSSVFTPASVRDLLDHARKLDPTAQAQFEFAKSLFEASDAGARGAFYDASLARADPDSASNYAALASYYVAVIDARSANSRALWAQVLENASKAGAATVGSARLICLAYLGRGGDPLKHEDGFAPCPHMASADPETSLLRGMYALRLAQFLQFSCPTATRADPCRDVFDTTLARHLDDAVGAFRDGAAQASQRATIDWLEQPAAQQPRLREALEFGFNLANEVRARSGCKQPYPAGNSPAAEMFRRLDLLGCRPSP